MSLNLSDDEIHGLIAYARNKFRDERYPFVRVLFLCHQKQKGRQGKMTALRAPRRQL